MQSLVCPYRVSPPPPPPPPPPVIINKNVVGGLTTGGRVGVGIGVAAGVGLILGAFFLGRYTRSAPSGGSRALISDQKQMGAELGAGIGMSSPPPDDGRSFEEQYAQVHRRISMEK